jgi:hypothetical protein
MIVFAQLKQGISSEAVYRLMGPPDYRWTTKIKEKNAFDSQMGPPDYSQSTEVEEVVDKYTKRPISSRWNAKCVAWRYDFGPQPDFSLILTWDDEGMLAKIEKVSPGLWHDNELFDDADGKPLCSGHGDVDINRIYSEHFRGKIEVVKIRATSDLVSSSRKSKIGITPSEKYPWLEQHAGAGLATSDSRGTQQRSSFSGNPRSAGNGGYPCGDICNGLTGRRNR